MIWDLYQQYRLEQVEARMGTIQEGLAGAEGARRAALALEDKVNQLALICRAMFELIQNSTGLSEQELRDKIVEIDLRDGQADGRMSPQPKRCPKCEAMMSPKFRRCLFCGCEDSAANPFV
jgi:hypothetical protein